MKPITRKEYYLAKAAGTYTGLTPTPVLREDYYLATLAGDYSGQCPTPVTRFDMLMSAAAGITSYVPQPVTRIEKYWYEIAKGTGYVPEPVTREEKFLYALVKNKPEPPKPEYVDKTAHGNPILLSDSAQAPLKALTVYGHSTQETTTGAQLLKPIDNFPQTKDGVTMSKNNDGSYHLQGTATAEGNFRIIDPDIKKYTLNLIEATISLSAKNGSYDGSCTVVSVNDSDDWNYIITATTTDIQTWSVVSNKLGCFLTYNNGSTYNVDIYPMLNSGNTALPWEPYTGGKSSPSPEYPQQIVSAGSVMIAGDQLLNANVSGVSRGVTYQVNGSIVHFSGITSESTGRVSANVNMLDVLQAGKTYYAKSFTDNVSADFAVIDNDVDSYVNSYTVTGTETRINFRLLLNDTANISGINVERTVYGGVTENQNMESWEPYIGGTPGINPYEGEIEIEVSDAGINILTNTGENKDYNSVSKNWSYSSQNNAIVTVTGNQAHYTVPEINTNNNIGFQSSLKDKVIFHRGQKYVWSCDAKGVSSPAKNLTMKVYYTNTNGNIWTPTGSKKVQLTEYWQRYSYEFTVPDDFDEDVNSIILNFPIGPDTTAYLDIKNLKLERGTIATKWTPAPTDGEPLNYQAMVLSTPGGLPGIPVTSGGNYTDESGQQWVCDEIDLGRGKYVQRVKKINVKSVIHYNSSENFGSIKVEDILSTQSRVPVMSNRFAFKTSIKDDGTCFAYENTIRLYYNLGSLENFNKWLTENDVVVWYPLDTPIETDLAAEEIAAYKSLHTYSPTTTVSNDAEAWMKVGYKANP